MNVEKRIPASIDSLASIEGIINGLYDDGKLSEEVYGNMIVAVTEAVLNAVNHGSKADTSKEVYFLLELEESHATVTIRDDGDGFDIDKLPDPTDPENLEKGSGRGIYIMRNLSDDITFDENGSKVIMKFNKPVKVSLGA